MHTRDGFSCQLWFTVFSVGFSHLFPIAVRWQVICVYKWPKISVWLPYTWMGRAAYRKRHIVKQSGSFELKWHFSLVVEIAPCHITVTWQESDLTISACVFQPVEQRHSRTGTVGYGLIYSRSAVKNADEHLASIHQTDDTDEVTRANISNIFQFPMKIIWQSAIIIL